MKAMSHLLAATALVLVAALPGTSAAQTAVAQTNPADLVTMFEEFRAIAEPVFIDGMPDYSDQAMARQHAQLVPMLARMEAIDDTAFAAADRVNFMLILAEMRGLDFRHRVLRPWKRDPAFYSTTNLGFGPKIAGAIAIPQLPLDEAQADRLAQQLAAVPRTLAQARDNLTEARGDLARLGIAQKDVEINIYDQLANDFRGTHPEVAVAAAAARDATVDFRDWLVENAPGLPPHGGIGRENYDYYLRHVLLFPYSWEEMRIIGEREYERAMTFLKFEEHRNRGVAMVEPVESLAAFEERRAAADERLLAFLRNEDVMTVPDYLVPTPGEGPYVQPAERNPAVPGPFEAPIRRHFFRQAEDRAPIALRAHNVPGHLFDQLQHERDNRPIRSAPRLYFIDGTRAEGWSFYLEEMIQQLGLLDDDPSAREINYILQAKRAARVLPELMLHANEWTFDEARESLTTRTPYWMEPNDLIAMTDLELYLRQPGYGIGYHIGKVQLEALLADMAQIEGRDFNLREFHDRFRASGMIPISLIRYEMTGRDDEIQLLR